MDSSACDLAKTLLSGVGECKTILAGPEIDDPRAWVLYRKTHPARTYAVSKRRFRVTSPDCRGRP
jgi:hypothetical protein